jgi:AraC-like DNA-binding protein
VTPVPTEVTVKREVSDDGSWSVASRRPHPGLAGHIGEYVGYTEQADGPVRRREVPHGAVTLIFGLGGPLDFLPASGTGPPVDRMVSFVAGLHDVHTNTRHAGCQEGIEVDLTALGASRLLGVPATALANSVVPIDAIRDRAARELVERLADAPDWPARFRVLDEVLLRWIDDGSEPDPAIRWAWGQLDRSHGRVQVSTLAEEIGWSRRHFAARFRADIGLPPKTVGRVLRFQRAVDLLTTGPYTSISAVAATCGFADHSHLVRDFRSMAGCTPSELVTDRRGDGLAEAFPAEG